MLLTQYENALKDFNKALAIEPENAKAYLYRGGVWQEQGKTKEAMKDYDKALGLNPSYADAFFLRAGLWEQKKQLSKAIKDYTKAIELNPGKSKYYTARAQLWMTNEKDVKKGIADLKKALEIEPNDARSCFQLGLLLNFQGEQVSGMDYLYKAGNIFANNKNRNGLITVIEEMAKINPKSPLVQQLYKLAYPDVQPGDSTFYNDELNQNDVSRTAAYDDDDDDEDDDYKGSTTSAL